MSSAPVSLGKGAWCCDTNSEIPPDKEAEVFEERPSGEILFEGMDTVPPRKNTTHVAVFHEGCRYRVKHDHEVEKVCELKKKLWDGGLGQGHTVNKTVKQTGGNVSVRSVVPTWQQLSIFFAGRLLSDQKTLAEENVPVGIKSLACLDSLKKQPHKESAYWC
tara:strand:- start:559 stop:1044 length:486 start_codon:yes stop_codon:yes gene_type:complete